MGLYYRAILSSLLLNFLPDLPRTFFFTPQYPILFFFTLAFTFSLSFFHITADLQQVKRKKNRLICLCRGNVLFFLFFSTQKSPFFVRTVVQNWQKLTTIPKTVTSTLEGIMTQKVATLYFYCGSSDSCFQLTIWRMACPHHIDILTEPPPK